MAVVRVIVGVDLDLEVLSSKFAYTMYGNAEIKARVILDALRDVTGYVIEDFHIIEE